MRIERYAHGERDFWQVMGPHFASARIHRELGIPMTSDESCTWFIALADGAVAGFAAVRVLKNNVTELKHAYVFESYRQQGVYTQLLHARINFAREAGCTSCRATVAPALQHHYAEAGFAEGRQQGRYTHFELHLGA